MSLRTIVSTVIRYPVGRCNLLLVGSHSLLWLARVEVLGEGGLRLNWWNNLLVAGCNLGLGGRHYVGCSW